MVLAVFCKIVDNMGVEKSDQTFYYEWENVSNVKTRLLKIDACVDDDGGLSHRKRLVLIVPGNPGIIQLYEEFAVALWENLGRTTAVWGVSYAGHVYHDGLTKETYDGAPYPNRLFQIKHKRTFIEQHIPSDIEEIIVVGHSMGSHASLCAAQQMSTDPRIAHIIGLFPTLERMQATQRGRELMPIMQRGRWKFFLMVFLVSCLPDWGKRLFLRFYASDMTDDHLREGVMNLTHVPCARNWFLAAEDCLRELNADLDVNLVKGGNRRVTLYYGRNDHWVPVECFTDLTRSCPDGDFHLCSEGYDHAFVIKEARPVAKLVASWINGSRKT